MATQTSFTGPPVTTASGRVVKWTLSSTSRSATYSIVSSDPNNVSGTSTHHYPVALSFFRKITSNKSRFMAFSSSLAEVLTEQPGRYFYFQQFSSLNKISNDDWDEAVSKLNPGKELALYVTHFSSYSKHHNHERIRAVKALASQTDLYSFVHFGALQVRGHSTSRFSFTEWMDLIDFLVNGDQKETFLSFKAQNSGRDFKLKKKNLKASATRFTAPASDRNERFDSLFLDATALENIVARFFQLSKRSRKLEDKLYNMPLSKLVQGLYKPIPGTLLVSDTIELIDALKHVRRSDKLYGKQHEQVRLSSLGPTWARKIHNADRASDFLPYLSNRQYGYYMTDEVQGIITDLPEDTTSAVFILYALSKLGMEKTAEMLHTLSEETDGVCMRAFMELVRRGGFDDELPAAWAAVLLPTN